MGKTATVIPVKSSKEEKIPVCCYARVSTKAVRAGDSLENQVSHYSETVGKDPRYELVEIYHDFGISGYKDTRPGFQRMMEDAEKGRFRLVITKAITRFARNTQTVLDATRRLKALGIGVFFELQNINTLSQEGELLMTLFAAFGQAESEGARMHTLMALQRRYDEGDPPRQLQRSMGYMKGPDGEFYPDKFAPLVLEMFEMAADGYTVSQITNYLNSEGITNHNGCAFHRGSVTRLLRNPAYKGDFIVRQYYVNDNRRLVKNGGEKPMLYIEDDHIPIVSKALWDRAQATLATATHKVAPTENKPLPLTVDNYPYKDYLFCARCGYRLNRAVRAGRVLWECNGKTKFTKSFCTGVSITDDEVRGWFKERGRANNEAGEEGVPMIEPLYISEVRCRGVVQRHEYITGSEWSRQKKVHTVDVPALNEENYPYMNHIFCKYCGSRLRRLINKNGTITWICDGLSRKGKSFCKGIRVPDEKLKPLAKVSGDFYIGKERVNGTGERFGYSRRPESARGNDSQAHANT